MQENSFKTYLATLNESKIKIYLMHDLLKYLKQSYVYGTVHHLYSRVKRKNQLDATSASDCIKTPHRHSHTETERQHTPNQIPPMK